MYKHQVGFLINLSMFLDALIFILGGYGAAYLRWSAYGHHWFVEDLTFAMMVLALMFINNYVMGRLGLYADRRYSSVLVVPARVALALLIDFSFLGVGLFAFNISISRLFLLYYAGIVFVFLLAFRLIMAKLLERRDPLGYGVWKVLLVGSDERAGTITRRLGEQKSWGHAVVGCLKTGPDRPEDAGVPVIGLVNDLEEVLRNRAVDEVLFALGHKDSAVPLGPYLEMCRNMGVAVRIVPSFYEPDDPLPVRVEEVQKVPTISLPSFTLNMTGLFYKRILDIVVGLGLFAVLAALWPFIALAVKLDSPGPVLFRQKRVGQNGRRFVMYKFRSMYLDAEARRDELAGANEVDGHMFKLSEDPRVTRVGRFLRSASLDELPQVVNVLKGEMSLVGTRPPTEDEVRRYQDWHRRRLAMKPGITGLWQVSGRSKVTDFNEVVRLDLEYIDNWRFLKDIKLLLLTIVAVLRRKGAY